MRHPSYDDSKAQSLVFTFAEQLRDDKEYGAPEPDFHKWVVQALFVDVAIAGDEAACGRLSAEEREAWHLYCNALEATGNLLDLYKANLELFQKVAGQMMFLPCFLSWHPDTHRFNQSLLVSSRLARQNMASGCQPKAQHLARQSWPVRYAYAIIMTIDLTLDTHEDRLPIWAEDYGYGVKHPIPLSLYAETMQRLGWNKEKQRRELPKYQGTYRILPAWTKGLAHLRRPFKLDHVLDYWRVGKKLILEEMPTFHLGPEWNDYHHRHYKSGAKDGAVQHAIFKDILNALKTIAGSNKRGSKPSRRDR